MDKDQSKGAAANQDTGGRDGQKADNASKGGLWQYQTPPQDPGAGAVQSNSAHYTGGAHGGDSQQGDFLKSSLEQNAMPAGAPQTSRGSAMGSGGVDTQGGNGPGAGAPGTDRDGMPGGSGGGESGGGGSSNDKASGAGGGQPAPVGNGTPDQPVWAT
ncbi:hypothetical protein [Massilia sp. BSC265]|uniref:hypothetical protein n=1 Tax=Massilia sp. BSC265 TaxID=1549812 RepID=UPI0004E8A33D|nr:hypothetical protein [Massilia sp. BSC265]KFI07690.1 hypothetical protein JN27_08985 [Massilia sp. BSC265]